MARTLSYVIYCEFMCAAIGWLLVEKGFFLDPEFHWKVLGAFLGFVAGGAFSTLIMIWTQEPE